MPLVYFCPTYIYNFRHAASERNRIESNIIAVGMLKLSTENSNFVDEVTRK